jgi:hypothetical protein
MADPTPRPIAQDCPCVQKDCPIWGDCEACIRGHRTHGRHVPECMQDLLRGLVKDFARKVEYDVVEARPGSKTDAQ